MCSVDRCVCVCEHLKLGDHSHLLFAGAFGFLFAATEPSGSPDVVPELPYAIPWNEVGANDRNDTDAQHASTRWKTHRKHIKGLATSYLGLFSETFICYVVCRYIWRNQARTRIARTSSTQCTVPISQVHHILTRWVDLISLLPNTRRRWWPRNDWTAHTHTYTRSQKHNDGVRMCEHRNEISPLFGRFIHSEFTVI